MKKIRLIVSVLVLMMVAVACQKTSPGGGESATEAPVSEASIPYPVSGQPAPAEFGAYPSTGDPNAAPVSDPKMLYPHLKDGDMLEWQSVEGTIFSGMVVSVSQKHDLQVSVTLKDGRTLLSTEPAIDDIIKIIQRCGDPCKDIKVATE